MDVSVDEGIRIDMDLGIGTGIGVEMYRIMGSDMDMLWV